MHGFNGFIAESQAIPFLFDVSTDPDTSDPAIKALNSHSKRSLSMGVTVASKFGHKSDDLQLPGCSLSGLFFELLRSLSCSAGD